MERRNSCSRRAAPKVEIDCTSRTDLSVPIASVSRSSSAMVIDDRIVNHTSINRVVYR